MLSISSLSFQKFYLRRYTKAASSSDNNNTAAAAAAAATTAAEEAEVARSASDGVGGAVGGWDARVGRTSGGGEPSVWETWDDDDTVMPPPGFSSEDEEARL